MQQRTLEQNLHNPTIAAIATPLGAGGIGIVRLSGSNAQSIMQRLFTPLAGRSAASLPPRQLHLGQICDAKGLLLDQALAVSMPAPHSYTGEDVVEFQLHGGVQLLNCVLQACLQSGARLAEPGEFTLRAFLNGKIDLSQAEAVADLISARTSRAANQAAGQLAGNLRQHLLQIEEQLTEILALVTVGVDFPDDEDALPTDQLQSLIEQALADIAKLLATARQGRIIREGVRVALAGAVNVGKSSLLNALLDAERAIVTDLPGTTRDVIEEPLNIEGIALLLSDTAGFRAAEQADAVERIGMERSWEVVDQSSVTLIVLDATVGLDEEALSLLQQTAARPRLAVINKCDKVGEPQLNLLSSQLEKHLSREQIVIISAREKLGMQQLKQALLKQAGIAPEAGSAALVSNLRQQQALQLAESMLQDALAAIEASLPADIAAIDVENALLQLGEISGRTASEEVLNTIFSRFCLGK